VNTLTVPIGSDGALVEVMIDLAAANVQLLRQSGRPLPQPIALRAVIDTAAEVLCIDSKVLTNLIVAGNLHPGRFVFASVPALGGVGLAPEYNISVAVLHPSGNARAHLLLRDHPVLEQSLNRIGYQGLLGRDVLNQTAFYWDGPGEALHLAY
jgi:hypothetical protein